MKVITGSARGRMLKTVEGLDVRPTTQKVKEAIFSAVQFNLPGSMVLDLFCGSGQMGIEALSRDASFAVFVDSDKRSQEVTKANLQLTGLFSNARVVAMDYKAFLSTTKDVFDVVFLDPPYSKIAVGDVLCEVVPHMSESGVIICEYDRDGAPMPETVGDFVLAKRYNYGRICVAKYQRGE